jgi:hypothetical protein
VHRKRDKYWAWVGRILTKKKTQGKVSLKEAETPEMMADALIAGVS